MKYAICEHGLFQDKRCRKHAKLAVGYRYLFGQRIGPRGEESVYAGAVTFRCLEHEKTQLRGEYVRSVPYSETFK